jgi:hypothetical protein
VPSSTTSHGGLRERLSDRLLASGADIAVDRERVTREIAATAPDSPATAAALRAMCTAEIVDSVVLWLSWRLRPRPRWSSAATEGTTPSRSSALERRHPPRGGAPGVPRG